MHQSAYGLESQRAESKVAHLDGLSRERVNGPRRSDLELVVDHVSKTLVVNASKIDVCLELFSGNTRIHRFVPVEVVSSRSQLFSKVVDGGVRIRESDGTRLSIVRTKSHSS